jgi:hypothetical protein
MYFPQGYFAEEWSYPKIDYCTECTTNPNHIGCIDNPLVVAIPWNYLATPGNCRFWLWGHGSAIQNGFYDCSTCFSADLFGTLNIGDSLEFIDSLIFFAMRFIPADCLVIKILLPNATSIVLQLSLIGPFSVNTYIQQLQYEFTRIA